MTREQLDAIRVQYATEPPHHIVRALLAEVERLTAEVEAKVTQNVALIGQNGRLQQEVERLRDAHAMAVQVSGELCEKCGWAMRFPDEPCRCELLAEVERLTAERAALQVGDTESTTLEANERFAPSENVVVYIERWCDGSGPCAVELEPHGHWRLSRSVSLASVRKAERDAAFHRGVAAMREAAIVASRENVGCRHVLCHSCASPASAIRALPDPEDKP